MWLGDVLLYTLKNVSQLFFLKKSNSQSDIWSSPRLARERKMKDPCRSGSTVGCVCVWERKFSFWKVVISQVSKESRRSGQPSFFPISFFYQKNHVRLIFMINPPGAEPKNLFSASKLFTNIFSLTFFMSSNSSILKQSGLLFPRSGREVGEIRFWSLTACTDLAGVRIL